MKSFKCLLILAMTAFMAVNVSAQSLFVGGSLGFNTTSNETTTDGTTTEGPSTFSYTIMPKAGLFLSDELAVGGAIGLSGSKTNNNGDPEVITTSTMFVINPFVRYYAINSGDFSIFAEGGLNMGFGSSTTESDGTSVDGPKDREFSIYVAPAISYAVSDNFRLEASIGSVYFRSDKQITEETEFTAESEDKSTGLGLNLGLESISFGAIVTF